MICTFCKEEIKSNEIITYTEDGVESHMRCQKIFEDHWNDREKFLDLMGY